MASAHPCQIVLLTNSLIYRFGAGCIQLPLTKISEETLGLNSRPRRVLGQNLTDARIHPSNELKSGQLVLVGMCCTHEIPHVTYEIEMLQCQFGNQPDFLTTADQLPIRYFLEIRLRLKFHTVGGISDRSIIKVLQVVLADLLAKVSNSFIPKIIQRRIEKPSGDCRYEF